MAEQVDVRFNGIDDVTNTVNKIERNVNKSTKSMQSNLLSSSFKSGLGQIGGMVAGVFEVQTIINFGKAIIETTIQFEKFRVMLNNAYQSVEKGGEIFEKIQKLATTTPYSLQEVTDGWIKIKNRGIEPTMDMLTKFGDIASSQGKSLDQFIEAFMDSLTGENERLKEFGIVARKNGDKVSMSFRGVTTEVENTEEGIGNYLLALGDLEGVHGSMAVQMDTLGGKVSNLGDSWDQLKFAIGGVISGPLSTLFEQLTDIANVITKLINMDFGGLNGFIRTLDKMPGGAGSGAFFGLGPSYKELEEMSFMKGTQKQSDKNNPLSITPEQRNVDLIAGYLTRFEDAAEKDQEVLNLVKKTEDMFLKGDVTKEQLTRRLAEIYAAAKPEKADITTFKKGDPKKLEFDDPAKDPSLNLSENRSLKNIYINIDKQVETLNITPRTLNESASEIEDFVLKLFQDIAVNIV